MQNFIITFIFFWSFQILNAQTWVRFIEPQNAEIMIAQKLNPISIKRWKAVGAKNFVNLSFFGHRRIAGTLFIDSTDYGAFVSGWPILSLTPNVGEVFNVRFGMIAFSGSDALVRCGKRCPIKNNKFARRKCPRTCIGVMPDGRLLIFVSKRSSLIEAAQKLEFLGCDFAMNVDGGGSTSFVEDGKTIHFQNRKIPVILSWK